MKNVKFWIVLSLVMAVFGLMFTGCEIIEDETYTVYLKSFNWSSGHSYWGSLSNGYYKGEPISKANFDWERSNNFASNAKKYVYTEDEIKSSLQKNMGLNASQAKVAAAHFVNNSHYWLGARDGSTLTIMMK